MKLPSLVPVAELNILVAQQFLNTLLILKRTELVRGHVVAAKKTPVGTSTSDLVPSTLHVQRNDCKLLGELVQTTLFLITVLPGDPENTVTKFKKGQPL